ncbi:hypothetical protein RRG08_018484 [Elysia crispata]|uniref:Uncharacterized protein n=1 Tax=Elysia crispata TaxID=231223 RepID=A0AAE1E1I7_9GAST|nr:hypothetical protein RRG08_018484 [Elysia crispata]
MNVLEAGPCMLSVLAGGGGGDSIIPAVIGAVVAVVVITAIIVGFIIWRRRKNRSDEEHEAEEGVSSNGEARNLSQTYAAPELREDKRNSKLKRVSLKFSKTLSAKVNDEASRPLKKPSKLKVAIILHSAGPEALGVFDQFQIEEDEHRHDPQQVLEKLGA